MLQFLIQFIKHPRKIGAIAPSGVSLAQKMMEPIDFTKARCITEYGPGTGSFTDELIREMRTILSLACPSPLFLKKYPVLFSLLPNRPLEKKAPLSPSNIAWLKSIFLKLILRLSICCGNYITFHQPMCWL